jgi:hypothetical protein
MLVHGARTNAEHGGRPCGGLPIGEEKEDFRFAAAEAEALQ